MSASEPDAASGDPGAWRVLLLGVVAWGTMGLATAGDPRLHWVVAAVTGLVALVAWRRSSWFLAALAMVAATCVLTGGLRAGAAASDPVTVLAAERATATVDVRLSGAGRSWDPAGTRPGLWIGSAELVAIQARGQAWTSGAAVDVFVTGEAAPAWAAMPMGSTVRATVRLGAAEAGSGLVAEVRAREPPALVAGPDAVAAAVGILRRGLVAACAPLWPDARALVPALVVGDTSGMNDDLRDRFVVTGLTHLTAVSGPTT